MLPRLAPAFVHRTRISTWLERNAELPLRFIAAPVGAGKTSAIASYLASRSGTIAYLTLKDDEGLEAFRERLARALGIGYNPASFDALVAALATVAPCEIALDEIDRATAETLEELGDLVTEAPINVSFIFGARSRSAIDVSRYLARGLGAMLDGPALAFDAEDIARLADLHGLSYEAEDIVRFLEETEGWPLVVSWALREAAGTTDAETSGALAGTFDRWRRANGRHFREFIDDELRAAGETYRSAFRASLRATGTAEERERLAFLEARGLFVYHADDAYRPYRVAQQFELDALPAPGASEPATLLVVRLFGRFEAAIGGRKVEWIRRREAQVFKYLLLAPNGTATRAELLKIFWPEADSHSGPQRLRTASSNIRKALAAIVGYGNVERYFTSDGDIVVALDRTVIDVRRFSAHVSDGDAESERGHAAEAFAHYRAAENIYSGELFGGEYPETWYLGRAAMYRALYLGVLERIAEYHTDAGRMRHANEYLARAAALRSNEPSRELHAALGTRAEC